MLRTAFQQHSQQPPNAIDLSSATGGSDWTIPPPSGLPNLPPTPISPYSPLRPLTEDDGIANPRFSGQQGGDWTAESFPARNSQQPCEPNISQVDVPLNRRQSAPTSSDANPPFLAMAKCKTDPGEAGEAETTSSYVGRQSRPSPTAGAGRRSSVQHSHIAMGKDHYHLGRRSSVQSFSQQSARTRVPHNLVERRYRDNLNNQIEYLRLTLPSLCDAQPSPSEADDAMTMGPRMPSKAVIISTAATYIKDLETERERLLDATKALQEQVSSLQKLVRCEDCSMMGYLNKMQVAN